MIRLNKYLADCGVCSRRKSDELIEQGRVSVNGNIILEFGYKVDENSDEVKVDGEKVRFERKVYFLFYKPKGTVTTTDDEKGRKTVTDFFRISEKIFPVGRLDFNTTGLLLMTNDGEFTNFITHPSNKIPREYSVKLDKPLEKEDKLKLEQGIYLDGRKSKFSFIKYTKENNFRRMIVSTNEGRNHFVKRMFSTLGYQVQDLKREKFGPFILDVDMPGQYRKITAAEIDNFYKMYKK